MIEIPLTSDGEQKFSITLEGITYEFRVIYNTRLNLWAADISTGGSAIANGVALVGGKDLVEQYDIPLRNIYAINTTGSNEDANANNLGTDVRLFQLTDEEVTSVSSV